jgi:hypothetical protein
MSKQKKLPSNRPSRRARKAIKIGKRPSMATYLTGPDFPRDYLKHDSRSARVKAWIERALTGVPSHSIPSSRESSSGLLSERNNFLNLKRGTEAFQEALRTRERLWRVKDRKFFAAYLKEFKRLRAKMPSALMEKAGLGKARAKLKMLSKVHKFESKTLFEEKTNEQGIPARFESVARVSSQLGKKNMLVGQEALISESPFSRMRSDKKGHVGGIVPQMAPYEEKRAKDGFGSPAVQMENQVRRAEALTICDFGLHPYTCLVFFGRQAFSHNMQWGVENWGKIKATDNGQVLGIQLFDPNPKTLLQFAKTMAKRRPKDPIPILDLYGRVFYP